LIIALSGLAADRDGAAGGFKTSADIRAKLRGPARH
jgi:hypothetical protein